MVVAFVSTRAFEANTLSIVKRTRLGEVRRTLLYDAFGSTSVLTVRNQLAFDQSLGQLVNFNKTRGENDAVHAGSLRI